MHRKSASGPPSSQWRCNFEDMPVVQRDRLQGRAIIGVSDLSLVYRSWLQISGYECIPVAVKEHNPDLPEQQKKKKDLRKEARAIKKLQGIPGVPKLYGVTDSAPEALVTGYSSGTPLWDLQCQGDVWASLEALLHTSVTVAKMHERGVAHRDLHNSDILAERGQDCSVRSASIVGYRYAKIGPTRDDELFDADMLRYLVDRILGSVTKSSEPYLYNYRKKFRWRNTVKKIGLLLCNILHRSPEDAPAGCRRKSRTKYNQKKSRT